MPKVTRIDRTEVANRSVTRPAVTTWGIETVMSVNVDRPVMISA